MSTCSDCRWWSPGYGMIQSAEDGGEQFKARVLSREVGECRSIAPTNDAGWPQTNRTDWCGEHEPRDSKRSAGFRRQHRGNR